MLVPKPACSDTAVRADGLTFPATRKHENQLLAVMTWPPFFHSYIDYSLVCPFAAIKRFYNSLRLCMVVHVWRCFRLSKFDVGMQRMKKFLLMLPILAMFAGPAFAAGPEQPIILAQAGNVDYRVSVLEEQVRQLNGKIEELNFQILELQERMRRMQEDNEFRFQQLEDKRGSLEAPSEPSIAGIDEGNSLGKLEPSESNDLGQESGGASQVTKAPRIIDGVEIYDGEPGIDTNVERSLGTIQFDENGNIIDTAIGKPLDLTVTPRAGSGLTGFPQDPDSLFELGFNHVQTGRYEDAQSAFDLFSQQYAGHPKIAEARFWLGESYLGRSQYREAAEIYLDTHQRWPNSRYAPQALLKLGVSVAGMQQRELACATFAEVLEKYPNSSRAFKRNVAFEQRATQCALN